MSPPPVPEAASPTARLKHHARLIGLEGQRRQRRLQHHLDVSMPKQRHQGSSLVAGSGAELVSNRVHLPVERAHLAKIAVKFGLLLLVGDIDELLHELIDAHRLEILAPRHFRAGLTDRLGWLEDALVDSPNRRSSFERLRLDSRKRKGL